jgi:hypothetical protein
VGIYTNPLAKMPRMNEQADQRRVRRALTDEELARLISVPKAIKFGRADYYTVVTLLGLRTVALVLLPVLGVPQMLHGPRRPTQVRAE